MATNLGPRDPDDDEEEPVEIVSTEDLAEAEDVASQLVEATEEAEEPDDDE